MVETALPVNIDQLLSLRNLERRARRRVVGSDATEEEDVLDQLDKDREGYVKEFLQTRHDQTVVPHPVAATNVPQPKHTSGTTRGHADGTSGECTDKLTEQQVQKKRPVVDGERKLHQGDKEEKYRLGDEAVECYQRDEETTYHQREPWEVDCASGMAAGLPTRENTSSPWSKLSEFNDSAADEGSL